MYLGNGKTHYITQHLTANSTIIAVNEAFSVSQVINKLNSLKEQSNVSIYFNFTLLPPGVSTAL